MKQRKIFTTSKGVHIYMGTGRCGDSVMPWVTSSVSEYSVYVTTAESIGSALIDANLNESELDDVVKLIFAQ